MIYLGAFLYSGLICLIGQIVLDNTKLTAGHITSGFTVIGALLSFFGIYPYIVKFSGGGASTVILNFGHLLYQGGINGYKTLGFIGIFTELLSKTSAVVAGAIIFSFVFAIFFKPKD